MFIKYLSNRFKRIFGIKRNMNRTWHKQLKERLDTLPQEFKNDKWLNLDKK
jgi:hypothetical protein